MRDPVLTEHDMIYCRRCIEEWIGKSDKTDPLTRKVFVTRELRSIPLIKGIIDEAKLLIPSGDIKISNIRDVLYDRARGGYIPAK